MTGAYVPYVVEWIKEIAVDHYQSEVLKFFLKISKLGIFIQLILKKGEDPDNTGVTTCIPNYNDIEHVFGQKPAVWYRTTVSTTVGKAKQNVSLEKLN